MSDISGFYCENNGGVATNHEILPLMICYEIWYDCLPNKSGLGHLEWSYVARVPRVVIRCKGPYSGHALHSPWMVKRSKCNKFKYIKNTSTCTWLWPHPISCGSQYLTRSDCNFHLLVWLENCTLFITSTS